MKRERLKKVITGTALTITLLLSGGMILGTTARAQDQDRDRYQDRDYRQGRDRDRNRDRGLSDRGRQIAEQNGYRTGLDRGTDDARHHRSYDMNRSSHYRDGDSGYHSEYGSKEAYKAAYREAFHRGYEEGYRRSGRRGR